MSFTARAVFLMLSMTLVGAGCAERTCERLCQWFEDVRTDRGEGDEPWEECQSVCESDYARAQNYCRDSFNDLSSCVDGLEAGDDPLDEVTAAECAEEIERARDDCACGMEVHSATCEAINESRP